MADTAAHTVSVSSADCDKTGAMHLNPVVRQRELGATSRRLVSLRRMTNQLPLL